MKSAIFLVLFFWTAGIYAQPVLRKNEKEVFSFTNIEDHWIIIALEKKERYLVVRYGSGDQVLWTYPKPKPDSWQQFDYTWYLRGGGAGNVALDLNSFTFVRDSTSYEIYEEYSAADEYTWVGWRIQEKDKEIQDIRGRPKTVSGMMMTLRDFEVFNREGEEP